MWVSLKHVVFDQGCGISTVSEENSEKSGVVEVFGSDSGLSGMRF